MDTPRDKQRSLGLRRGKCTRTDTRVKYKSLEAKPSRTGQRETNDATQTPKPRGSLHHLEESQPSNGTPSQEPSQEESQTPRGVEARLAASTGKFRPYRLALSKRLRDSLTVRRLEFQTANEPLEDEGGAEVAIKKEENNNDLSSLVYELSQELGEHPVAESPPLDNRERPQTPPKSHDRALLIARIEEAKRNRDAHEQKELRKKTELQASINMWRMAFVRSMNELQDGLESGTDMESIVQQLHIPEPMLKYLSE